MRIFALTFFLIFVPLVCPASPTTGTPVRECMVIAEYPHESATSTQGLFFHNSMFYESSGGYGRSFLAIVEPETGRILRTHPLDNKYFAEGIARHDDAFHLLTWKSGTGFILGLSDLKERSTFAYRPFHHSLEGWGLAFDGNNFILSSGSDELIFHTPGDFARIKAVHVTDQGIPVRMLNELEYVNGWIYANIWKSDRIAVIAPATGHVVGWIDLSPLRKRISSKSGVANGIAYDAQARRLYVTGKHWDKMFEIAIPKF